MGQGIQFQQKERLFKETWTEAAGFPWYVNKINYPDRVYLQMTPLRNLKNTAVVPEMR